MSALKNLSKANRLRWLFFAIASVAVIALTSMNVYSLYALRESTIESAKDVKKAELNEFTNHVRYRFYRPFWGISKLDMDHIERVWDNKGKFPRSFTSVLDEAVSDSLFSSIYYAPSNEDICNEPDLPIYKYSIEDRGFIQTHDIPGDVCDGLGLSKSRVKVIPDDYQWNNRVTFDAHRSLTLSLINLTDRKIIGHLNLRIDHDYLLNDFLIPEMKQQFGPGGQSGIVVWLRDWMNNTVLSVSDADFEYDNEKYQIDIRQRFTDSLNEWVLHASFLESPTVAASDASFQRNLIVLSFAVVVLFGALLFIFVNAQRERELASRQAGFLANITHELKTPLTVMQAAGENIADGRVTDGTRLRNYGDHIYQESVRLRKMIDKLLDAAKVDSGQAVAEQIPIRLSDLVEEFYVANKEYIENKGFEFNLKRDEEQPLVMVDPDHIETILNNLVENAMKYSSDEKSITLETAKNGSYVNLSISDKGDGIPKKSLNYIFDKFYRVENSLTAKTKGHGLGLAIVKNMVELNGGKIIVNSKLNAGSTFTIQFPKLLKSDIQKQEYKSKTTDPKSPEKTEDQVDQYA